MKSLNVVTIIRRLAALGAVAVALCGWAAAATLSGAFGSADAIVQGSVATFTNNITSASFTINVEAVLRGSVGSTGIPVSHPWSYSGKILIAPPPAPWTFAVSLHGVWFLQRTPASTWDVIPRGGLWGDPYSLFWQTPATLSAAYESAPGAPLLDTLMLQAAAGVEAVGVNPQDLRGIIETYPPAPPSMAVQTILARFVTLSTPGFREVGVACMLETGAPGAITQLQQLGPSVTTRWADMIAVALEQFFRDTTPSSVTQLAQYASAGTTTAAMRKAAVRALAAIHTKEALPFLAGLLSSSDPYEQGQGIYGLGAFANGCPPQTPGNVVSMDYISLKNPSRFKTADTIANFAFGGQPVAGDPALAQRVTFWQNWWSVNGPSTQ
ncbi:MAG TPA: HEAT repeat domain-containing protein [Bryobacteraceae bacterium]